MRLVRYESKTKSRAEIKIMKITENSKMMLKVKMMAVLLTGLFFFGAGQMKAQEEVTVKAQEAVQVKAQVDCKSLAAGSQERMDCWVKKAKSGQKDLKWAFLFEADLSGVDLRGVDLFNADLNGANLSGADLRGASLSDAELSGAKFAGAKLEGTDFDSTDLTDADFRRTDLTGAKMKNMDIRDAIVSPKTTIGINFEEWKDRGGKVVD